ncbi:aminotransferase class I/II-fold pyridoxal phosphate-dependent enzyme [Prochlorococcus marinus XMU1419]|uniref:aminotransferase class I/II-fold pyridoxal phosphate-dependent enzyme n=1 Tax=Prochlorococcus marinus TaxID=1219 RepID=UPI001ADB66A4|nr:aminotransferase class I/II-fold pyridoxal phosphate-dependent enzyme [Prochlorococcus marinus]MBO8234464.1 aminotransferase class I/II-fold pyridoxal phosphate-dependent enzyme [Prochlorococcus marinus XMU1419]MBW3076137.1 8-amino-7-oxononanoate synthase [Prochlorococcus marinus str. XMU1419]
MKKIKIPKNRIRKLKTFSLGKKPFELISLNSHNKKLIDLCSNDYFGLSRDKDLIKAGYEISLSEGFGAGSSRFITGSRPIHKLLEKELAEWLDQQKVFIFPSGFQANIAAIQSLANRNSIVIADKLIHNSLLVGIKATQAKLIRFAHNNLKDLEDKIIKSKPKKSSILVVVESLYSMEGSIAPLREITQICKKNSIQLLVDEAHSIGILGPEGRGLSFNYRSDITMITGTFGKAFGSGGAFIATNSEIGEYLIQTSGAFRYTTALAPSLAAGALEGLKKIVENKEWGNDLLSSAEVWKNEIIKNFSFPVKGDSHILSIVVGQEENAIYLQKYLEKNGFLAIAIRPPTVPVGQSRIRITIRRNLDFNLLKNFIKVLKDFK